MPNRSGGTAIDNHPVGVWYDAMAGNQTAIDNTTTNNNPHEVVFAMPNFNPAAQGGTYVASNLGVYYHNGKWAIFNEDNAAMPQGTAFDVIVSNVVS